MILGTALVISRFSLFSVTVARSARAWRPRREPPPLTGRTTSVATRPELVPVHAGPVSRDPIRSRQVLRAHARQAHEDLRGRFREQTGPHRDSPRSVAHCSEFAVRWASRSLLRRRSAL
ncbi:hypothetical protein LG3211_4356 [Lysobacter gummosus]|nr:hypothetical protein LG3211_4356 [Lysobacter gummosus]